MSCDAHLIYGKLLALRSVSRTVPRCGGIACVARRRTRTFEGFESLDVWPLCTEALSTSFRLLPLVACALPLRRSRAFCSFSLFAGTTSSLCCRLGGIVSMWRKRSRSGREGPELGVKLERCPRLLEKPEEG